MLKVSVIIPVYKVEQYIEKCVTSLMTQTMQDIEFIFVNDCSPDNSIEVLNKTISRYPERLDNIKIINLELNKGQAAARNFGVQYASGEFIAFVDSDDWVNPSIYDILYNNAKKEDALISCCGIERVCNGEHVAYFNDNLDEYIVYTTKDAIANILYNKRITCSPCDKIFHKSILVDTPMLEGIIFEDFEVMPRWIHKSEYIVYSSTPLYYYRANPQSTMSVVTKKRLNEVAVSELRIKFFQTNYPDLLEAVIDKHFTICLNVLSCTARAVSCENERIELRKKVLDEISLTNFCHLSLYSKIKYLLLLISLRFFDRITLLK